MDKSSNTVSPFAVRLILAGYGVIVLTLIIVSAANYPVQWRRETNHERRRYLEVYAQAIEYYKLDHEGTMFPIPEEAVMIANTDSCEVSCPVLGRTLSCRNLESELTPSYMAKLLSDPLVLSTTSTGFYVSLKDSQLTVGACHSFFGEKITVEKQL